MREIVERAEIRVSLLDSTRGSYAYLVEDATHAILVDTGFTGKGPAILAELHDAGKTLTDIVITHYDVDHVGSLKALEDAVDVRIHLPADDAPYILGQKPRPGIKRLIGAVVRVPAPTRWTPIRDGDQVGALTAVASPGHTPGHLAYRGPGFLLVGDAITTRGSAAGPSPAMLAWNANLMRTSAAGLLSGFRGWILPAHGEPLDVQG
ncbi:MAG: MBL fold metallo-hydrolase [Clostridia bacterium]